MKKIKIELLENYFMHVKIYFGCELFDYEQFITELFYLL